MKKLVLAGVLASSLALAACSDSADEVIVSTSFGEITQGEFYDDIKSLAGTSLLEQIVMDKILNEMYEATDDEIDEQYQTYVDQYGESLETLLTQNGYTEETFKDSLKFQVLQQKAMEDVDVTDEEIQEYYDMAKYKLSARHILVATEDEANEALKRINAGEDFATVAKEVSTDSSTAEDGGSLDWFTVGEMDTSFNAAAYALEVDEISEPVESEYGYHIIQLLDKKEVEDYGTLEEEKEDIIQAIKEQKAADTEWEDVEVRLIKEAKVDIKDSSLKGAFSTEASSEETTEE